MERFVVVIGLELSGKYLKLVVERDEDVIYVFIFDSLRL